MIPQNAITDLELLDEQPSLTWGIDFDLGVVTGYIDEIEAVKQDVFLCLSTERFRHEIYSWDRGVEFSDLFGRAPSYVYPELERRVKEALLVDDRISDVTDFTFTRNKSAVAASFKVVTIYGSFNTQTEVSI